MAGRAGPTILLVEYRTRTRRRLARVLEERGIEVVALGDLVAARSTAAERTFDAWVFGRVAASEGDDDVLALIESLRSAGDRAPILVVSATHDRRRASRCHRLGASCVYEPLANDTLALFAARAALDTGGELERQVDALGVERALTQREVELALLVGRGLARKDIAAALATQESTAKALVRSLLGKTGHTSLDALARSLLEARLQRAAIHPRRTSKPLAALREER